MSKLRTLGPIGLLTTCLWIASLGSTANAQSDAKRSSLEELLAQQRQAASIQLEAARGDVVGILATMRSLSGSKVIDPRMPSLRSQLHEYGPAIAPLLLPALEGPEKLSNTDRRFGVYVAETLEQMDISPIETQLLALAARSREHSRVLAIRVLGSSKNPNKVGQLLAKIYKEEPALQASAVRSLCRLGGPQAEIILTELLASADAIGKAKEAPQALIAEALAALAESAQAGMQASPGQLQFLRSVCRSRAGGDLLSFVVDFAMELAPGTFDEEDTRQFISMAANRLNRADQRILLLGALPDMGVPFERDMEKGFKKITDAGNPGLVQAGHICLARFGNKNAKKLLLKPYSEKIAQNRNDASAYQSRGKLLSKLGEYNSAIIDFKKAIKLNIADKKKNDYSNNTAYTGLAKAQSLSGDQRLASKALKDSSLSTVQLRNLAKDPDFKALVEDQRYNSVFRL